MRKGGNSVKLEKDTFEEGVEYEIQCNYRKDDGSIGFSVEFKSAGAGPTGTSVICEITSVGGVAQNIGYTVQVGHDSTNALTFTPAST